VEEQLEYFIRQASKAGIVPADAGALGSQIFQTFQANIKAVHQHESEYFPGRITLIRPTDQMRTGELFDDATLGWETIAGGVDLYEVPGDHAGMLRSPAVEKIADLIKTLL
jgi:thioesterase domain-containing protein